MTNPEENASYDPGGRIAFRMDPPSLLLREILSPVQQKEAATAYFEYLEKCTRAELELIKKILTVLKDRTSKV